MWSDVVKRSIIFLSIFALFPILDITAEVFFNGHQEFVLDLRAVSDKDDKKKKPKKEWRKYHAKVTAKEKEDIAYIVNTLGMETLLTISNSESSIREAGKRVEHIHPLRFLIIVFTDEELKASFHAMDGRTWVWSDFIGGLTDNLDKEFLNNNLKQFLQDFSNQVGVKHSLIKPVVENRQWLKFVDLLIENIPRNSDADRYNI